jgi:hypothetical protein
VLAKLFRLSPSNVPCQLVGRLTYWSAVCHVCGDFNNGSLSRVEDGEKIRKFQREQNWPRRQEEGYTLAIAVWRGAISRELGGWVQEPRYRTFGDDEA